MSARRFSTFEGVFTPCVLSLLGVIMYLRLGWVVGQVGLGGALLIIFFSHVITICTALSMSSVVTNIRIGVGGAYSIISKSLGIEAGGAIGFPLYISQAISVAFYITGFAECWLFIFPDHSILLVSLIAWLLLLIVSYISAKLAFRIQYMIMTLIGLSLLSIVIGQGQVNPDFSIWRGFSPENFWMAFAIFFPAVTGILAGASMSGELIEPRKSIPHGTLGAIFLCFAVYLGLAVLFAKRVPLPILSGNPKVAIEMGRWQSLVIAGTMGATLSSALAMFVGAPRILLALGKHAVFPFSSSFAFLNKKGEPTTAILLTALISLLTLLNGSLNQIASLLTMFFLITYGIINLTVLIEQVIGIPSYRPSLRIPKVIPFLGSVGCLMMMFLINVKFSFIAMIIIILIYFALLKRGTKFYSPDIRSGMLVFLAEQFVKSALRLPYSPKIWKPNMLVPIRDKESLKHILPFVRSIVFPSGRLTIVTVIGNDGLGVPSPKKDQETESGQELMSAIDWQRSEILDALRELKEDNLFYEVSVARSRNFHQGVITIMQAFKGIVFPPNILFYLLPDWPTDQETPHMIEQACQEGLGVIVLKMNEEVGFSQEKIINLWIRQGSPNMDLAALIALQLEKNWNGMLRLIQVVSYETEKEEAEEYLARLSQLMRLSTQTKNVIMVGQFMETLQEAPAGDINIFGMPEQPDYIQMHTVADRIKTSVIYLRDSKHESVFS